MARVSKVERTAFIHTVMDHIGRPDMSAVEIERIATLILRHSTTYCNYQEMWCNVDLGDKLTAYYENREARLEQRITELAASLGCGVTFSGDPRGCTVKLTMPDGYTDDWGNTGLCVPTS